MKILVLEDDPADFEIIKDLIESSNIKMKLLWAQSRQDFQSHLENPDVKLVLADYAVPSFSGVEALEMVKESKPNLPFIFVTGIFQDEQIAAETVLAGGSHFVLKDNLNDIVKIINKFYKISEEPELDPNHSSKSLYYSFRLINDIYKQIYQKGVDANNKKGSEVLAKLYTIQNSLNNASKKLEALIKFYSKEMGND